MFDGRRLLWPLLAAGMLLVLGWWLTTPAPAPESAGTGGAEPPPDYYLTDTTIRRYTPDQRLAASLHSPRITHDQASGVWRMVQPRWTYRGDSGAWTGEAEHGMLETDRDVGTLTGNVRLSRLSEPGVTLTTNRLDIQPRRGYAQTDRPVTLHSAHWRQSGVGARAWLDSERMELLSKVEGSYDSTVVP